MIQVASLLIYNEDVNVGWRVFFSLFFPFAVFAKGLGDLGEYAADDKEGTCSENLKILIFFWQFIFAGLRWEDRADYGFFPLSEQWTWYGVNIGLYIVLTWFFDAIIYLKLKPWFMFTRAYWVGAKKRSVKTVSLR